MQTVTKYFYTVVGILCMHAHISTVHGLENELITLRDDLNALTTTLSANVSPQLKPKPKTEPKTPVKKSTSAHPGLQVVGERTLSNGKKIIVGVGYLEQVGNVDAIVNAANANLQFGSGVAGSIAQALGPQGVQQVYAEIKANYKTPVAIGSSTPTKVPAGTPLAQRGFKYILHAVGPDCRVQAQKDQWKSLLTNAYVHSLNAAKKLNLTSIILPPLSIGVFSCDYKGALNVMTSTVVQTLQQAQPSSLQEVILVVWSGGKNPENTANQWLKAVDNAIKIATL